MRFRLALGRSSHAVELPRDQSYDLLLLDAGLADNARQRCGELASDLIRRCVARSRETTSFVVYRLGQRRPVAVPGEEPSPEELLPAQLGRRPRLLAPVLESRAPERVRFVVLLAGGSVIDADDWSDSAWNGRIFSFALGGGSAGAFVPIPRAKHLDEADAILRHLALHTGGLP